MKIDRRLNIVLPVEREDGTTIHVHSSPIRREIYERNFLIFVRANAMMYENRMPPGLAQRTGLLMLRKVAEEMGGSVDPDGKLNPVQRSLETVVLPEIWRLTNVAILGDGIWRTVPFEVAIKDATVIDPDDVAEVQNALCFFTSVSWGHPPQELKAVWYPLFVDSGAQIVSSNCTDFASSLPTSTQVENTGATETASSIPS